MCREQILPVSYTHLDVYKRQVFVVTVSKLIGEEERSCKMQILYGTEVKATISIMETGRGCYRLILLLL